MNFGKDRPLWHLKWHVIAVYIALLAVVLFAVFAGIFRLSAAGLIPQLVWLLAVLAFLMAILVMISKALRKLDTFSENSATLEKIAGSLEKIRTELVQVNQGNRISERAKAIAFRDADRRSLREAVFDKLQQKDFEATYEIIDEIARSTVYKELAEQLRTEADRYQDATDAERVNQIISHIEKLFEEHQWAKASALVERLIKTAPESEKAKEMWQRLLDKKEERKKILLNAWDDAVKRQATDRSLEILRELDLYLTPNEGLALQEAARDVFRNKLHNLGVQFSLAVSGKQWARALQTGRQIIRDFPNSRMAEEIRERCSVLEQRVKEQAS